MNRIYVSIVLVIICVLCSCLLFVENRCLELHSPDGVHSCILRASDSAEALVWFNALHSAMSGSTQRALVEANRALINVIGELKHIGWLSRRLSSSSGSGNGGGGGIGSGSNASAVATSNAITGTTTSVGSAGEVVSNNSSQHRTKHTNVKIYNSYNFIFKLQLC